MKPVLAAIFAVVVWSSAFAGVSTVVVPSAHAYTPGEAALLRFLVASAATGIWALATRMRLPDRADLPRLAMAALLGITTYHLAFNYGESTVSAGAAALVIAAGPIFTALMAVAFLGERLNKWGWAGVLTAFAGVSAIAFGEGKGGFGFSPGVLIVAVAAMATAGYFVVSKKPLRKYSALEFTFYAIWLGTIPLLVFAPGLAQHVRTAPAWATWTVVYLGVFPGALAYTVWSYALQKMPASTTASFLYGQPVLATLVAWAWQGVVPSAVTLAGGGVALAGVLLVNFKGRPSVAPAGEVASGEAAIETDAAAADESLGADA
jgi:drug/metabolite transporter (DMT)-like permease